MTKNTGNKLTFRLALAAALLWPEAIQAQQFRLDVEPMNHTIDLRQDVSQLSLCEARVLRNALAARQGYCFMSADLRGLFASTTWYDSLMERRWWAEEEGVEPWSETPAKAMKPIAYSAEELAFIKRLKAREEQLRRRNFIVADTTQARGAGPLRVNIGNIANPFQLAHFPQTLKDKLAEQGFAIVAAQHEQLFHVYENNDYHQMPSFVTTDLYLQLYHVYFDALLKETEHHRLMPAVRQLCHMAHNGALLAAKTRRWRGMEDEAQWVADYFDVALCLLDGRQTAGGQAAARVDAELARCLKAEDAYSDFIGQPEAPFMYSLFRPRGHYADNDSLKQYFRAMMWLQTVPFATDKDAQLRRAAVMADLLLGNDTIKALYRRIASPLDLLVGLPDGVSVVDMGEAMGGQWQIATEQLVKKKPMKTLRREVEALCQQRTRLKPKHLYTSRHKLYLMPQRYMPDAEVLQELVDYDSPTSLRPVPTPLDVFAALGDKAACRLAAQTASQWPAYPELLEKEQQRLGQYDMKQTVATRWMETIARLNSEALDTPQDKASDTRAKATHFMQGEAWQLKNLNTALASWAELKHDAILYAKQPIGAECGGAGPPDPVTVGYVEPNVRFWRAALKLLSATAEGLEKVQMLSERATAMTMKMKEMAEFLLRCADKELAGQRLSDDEYRTIELIGSNFEYITLDLLRENDAWLEWESIEGSKRKVALVADVYTANADNNPEKSVLYAAVGPADDIYVVVEIDGLLYLTRGAVFSYRELTRPLGDPRMTDDEWQEHLMQHPDDGRPTWMQPAMAPLKEPVRDNERILYSSGC